MSSDKQEDSIERQREQIAGYCVPRGIEIIGEYVDEGIPGSDANLHRRDSFHRLCTDAKAKRFDVVLVDKTDRLSRADPIDFGATVKPLRDAGIRLETVNRGPIDWKDAYGQMSLLMEQSGNNQYAKTISYNVLSRLRQLAGQGITVGCKPYGYLRDKATRKLVPDPDTAKVVQFIFRSYADGVRVSKIIEQLYERGAASPRGKSHWRAQVILMMLANRVYVGDFVWNKWSRSEYHRVSGREVRQIEKAGAPDLVVIEDNHPPLIDRATWERVQARRAAGPRPSTPHKGGGDWTLSGLLICGRCGCRMQGSTLRGRRSYVCGTYRSTGCRGCGRHAIREDAIRGYLAEFLKREFLDPDRLATLREEMAAQAELHRRQRPAAVEALQAQLAKLEAAIDKGARKVLEADDEDTPDLKRALAGMRRERADLEARVRKAAAESPAESVADEVRRAEAVLWSLREGLESAEPERVRAVFAEMIGRVELHFEAGEGRRKTRFSRGIIYLRQPDRAELRHVFNLTRPPSSSWRC
jgi:site-specific DNA recombinase